MKIVFVSFAGVEAATVAIGVVALASACMGPNPSSAPPSPVGPTPTETEQIDAPAYMLDCGPEFSPDCEKNGFRIATQVTQAHPGRIVVKVLLTDRRGSYLATLDDQTTVTGRVIEE